MKLKKGDFLVVFLVLALAVGIWLYPVLTAKRGETVRIEQNGVLVEEVSLSETKTVALSGCTVKIENGCAYVSESSCPDLVCVKSGRISSSGETIICVPNHVKVSVSGAREIDAISG